MQPNMSILDVIRSEINSGSNLASAGIGFHLYDRNGTYFAIQSLEFMYTIRNSFHHLKMANLRKNILKDTVDVICFKILDEFRSFGQL